MGEDFIFSALVIKKQSLILFLLRLPAFIPWIFVARGWFSLNEKDSLTNTEADILGTGGEIAFFLAVSITPLITVTGARWIAPLRRWYGIMFMLIGISDATTAAISTDFAGGVFGRLAGHTFLVTGLFIVLMGIPVLATANTPAQRRLGKHWKSIQRVTYALWALIVVHLLLLDGFKPFGAPEGDGDPVFHQRFYQAVAISLPLVILRLPPVKRWCISKRADGQQWKVWLLVAVIGVPYVVGMIYIINEEILTGMMCLTMHPPAN
jgi:DMSO/TMAO reductase YedYZ heme-binding membrane subunit